MTYTLSILGQPVLEGPEGPLRYTATKAQALLWHLAAQPETAFSRSHLTTILWPDDTESEGRNRLNTTLSRLRQALPVWPIRQNGDMLQWDRFAGMGLDTLRFLEISRVIGLDTPGHGTVQSGRLEVLAEAVSLWRGPLLQGFTPSFSSTYEEWLEQERAQWERRILEALARLVQLEDGHRTWDRMIGHCQQALAIDPLQERFHRWLMTAYYQTGERAAALNQYTLCAQIMEAQLGATPDPATTRLREQIAHGELDRPSGQTVALPAVVTQGPLSPTSEIAGLSGRDLQVLAAWAGRSPGDVRNDPGMAAMGMFALTDPLTGLYNRRYLETLLEAEIGSGKAPTLALLEMQGLRRINDSLGSERGDTVLRTCATYLKEELSQGVLARTGGGGFAVLFPDLRIEAAADLVQQVLTDLPAALVVSDLRGSMEFAAGLAAYPDDGTDLAALQRAAEGAVYWAKKQRVRRVRMARELVGGLAPGDPHAPEVSSALAGRESLWKRMEAMLDQAAAGRGGLLVLDGPVGSGKSRLLTELAHAGHSAGFRVVEVAPDPSAPIYQPITAALRALTGKPPQPLPENGMYPHITELVHQLQQVAADGAPILLCLDDLHEAGNLTALALLQLSWKLHRQRILVAASLQVGANQIFDWSSLVTMGVATKRIVREQVVGLDLNGVRRLAIAELGSVLSGPAIRMLQETTGGNPLHVTQVLKTWVETGVMAPGPNGWTVDFEAATQAPRDLFEALIWRVKHLEPEVQEMLGLAAVLGRQFQVQHLGALTGTSGETLLVHLDRTLQDGLIQAVEPDLLRFAHPILQEAAYSTLPAVTRRLAHGMAGLMLVESGGAGDAALARHFDGAGEAKRSYAYHLRAGKAAAARHAYVAARHHLGRAWQIMPLVEPDDLQDPSWLPHALCQVSMASGDSRTAMETCREALQHPALQDPPHRAALLLEMGHVALASGDLDAAARALAGVEELLEQLPPEERLKLTALRVHLRLAQGRDEAGLAEALHLAEEARAAGQKRVEGMLLSEAALSMLALGHARPAVADTAQRAIACLPPDHGPAAPIARITAALAAGTTPDALGWVEEALEAAVLAGEVVLWPRLLHVIGRLERASGSWEVARRVFEASLLIAGRTGDQAERCTTMGEMALLLAWTGEHEEAEALATAAVDTATTQGRIAAATSVRIQLARCQIAAGAPREALRTLSAAGEAKYGTLGTVELRLVLLDALIQAGELHRALAEAAGLPKPQGDSQVYHALLLGRLARRQGRPQEALRWLNQAIAQDERPFAEQYEIAQAYAEQAYALHALGDVEPAEQRLQTAREMLVRMGAMRGTINA